MVSVASVRIACDGDHFEGPVNLLDGRKITIWRGSALRLELAFFRRGVWQDLADVAEIIVEMKEMGPRDGPPPAAVPPLLRRRIFDFELDLAADQASWEAGTGQQAVVEFSGEETAIPAGDCWLSIWARTAGEPSRTLTFAAGRIAVRESSAGVPTQPAEPLEYFYDRQQCDDLFLRRDGNLLDLADGATARQSLGLGAAALLPVLDEDDLAANSAAALPTQRSVRAYADAAHAQALAYVDGRVSAAAPVRENLWPGSLRPLFSSYASRPYFLDSSCICSVDGWMISQASATSAAKCYFEADGDAIVFSRPAGSGGLSPYYMNRVFSRRETELIAGKVVTLSLDLKFASGFPLSQTGHGLVLSVTMTSSASSSVKANGDGTFSAGTATVATFPEIGSGSPTAYERHSFTFTVPSTAKLLCISLSHTPIATAASDYRFYLANPALALGEDPVPYAMRSWSDEYFNNCQRFVRMRSSFCATVSAGTTAYDHCVFPMPMEQTPICLRGTDVVTPTAFPAAGRGDIVDLSPYGFTVARVASGNSPSAKWQTLYGFAVIFWDFSDGIGSY